MTFLGLLLCLLVGCKPVSGPQQVTGLTTPVPLDSLVQEGYGPTTSAKILVLREYPELVFLTGASVRVVPKDASKLSPERAAKLLCRASIRLKSPPARHAELLNLPYAVEPNLFVFGPGVSQVRLPEGFGIPLRSNEPLWVSAEWMNEDVYLQASEVQLEATVYFSRGQLLKPLRPMATFGWALVKGQSPYFGVAQADPKLHGPGCVGSPALVPASSLVEDGQGGTFQSKWRLPPGKLVNHTLIDKQLTLPVKVHAAAPMFSSGLVSLSLRDLTSDQAFYNFDSGLPVALYPEGVSLAADHHYELTCSHANPRKTNGIALAMIMLYVEDTDFKPGETP